MKSEKIQRTSVVAEAMRRIKNLLSSEKYKVGDRIPTEVELAERFGLGRSSIREAIKVFVYLGILEVRVPKGTFICSSSNIASEFITWFSLLNQDEVYEILEIREAFEQKGVDNIVMNASAEEKKETLVCLQDEISKMKTAIGNKDYSAILQADFNFHKIIVEQTKNKLFVDIFLTLRRFTEEEMRATHMTYENLNKLIRDHESVLDAIKTDDPNRARKVHRQHFPLIKSNLPAINE